MKKIVACVLSALLLTGCVRSPDVEELLRAPQYSGPASALQKALSAYLGDSPQLKYPTGGANQSPFLFGDWNGDGQQDAGVLYASPSGSKNVCLALLEQQDGSWAVSGICEGLSADVREVNIAPLNIAEADQILIGYDSGAEMYLGVYAWSDDGPIPVLETHYNDYLLANLTKSGGKDLVIVQTENDQLQLQLLKGSNDGLGSVQTLTLAGGRFTSCADLSVSEKLGRTYLAVDGYTGTAETNLATELLLFDRQSGELKPFDSYIEPNLYKTSLRNFLMLHSMDIDKNGCVEIPVQLSGSAGGTLTEDLERRLTYVLWRDFTAATEFSSRISFGVADAEYGFYLELPKKWMGRIHIRSGKTEGWQIYDSSEEVLYADVRVTDIRNQIDGYARAALSGRSQVLIRITDEGKEQGFESVSGRVILLS